MSLARRILPVAPVVLAGLVLASVPVARAHQDTVSTSDVEIGEREIVWRAEVDVAVLRAAGRLRGAGGSATRTEIDAAAPAIATYLAGAVEIVSDGQRLPVERGALEPQRGASAPDDAPVSRLVQVITFHSAPAIRAVRLKVSLFSDVDARHRSIVHIHWHGRTRSFVRAGPDEIALTENDLDPSVVSVVWEFLRWGIHHIFLGYDHLAFLFALLLAATSLRELVRIVTSFTLAHSATLCLAGLGLLRIPNRVSEVLIAASIIYVAVENLRTAGRALRHRSVLTFSFGLVHGLGFAAELRERLLELGGRVLLPVASFNVGVELGQILIVALVYPLLRWLRAAPTERGQQLRQKRLVKMGSVPILLLGLFWFVDRLLR